MSRSIEIAPYDVTPAAPRPPRCEPATPLGPRDAPAMESLSARTGHGLLALAIAIGYGIFVLAFWAPAHPGVDQNGYLVGAKRLALTGSMGMTAAEPYAYVGAMWVRMDDGEYFPKYPVGLPLLYAALLRVDWDAGRDWAYLVSPLCMTLSVWGMFLFGRAVAGSFAGICAMLLLGFGQTALLLANNPNSHAAALLFALWGMFHLHRWSQTGALWRGALAGLLLGYAVTIRYTEGLLLLPMAAAALGIARLRRPRTWLRALAPALAWAIPVGAMVVYNLRFLGSVTGYDTTYESTGFSLAEFRDKWEYAVQQLQGFGLFLVLPVGLLGMLLAFRGSVRLGLLLTLWFFPGAAAYTAYYWGEQAPGTGFLRFFLTLFPPVILGAVWAIAAMARGAADAADRRRGSVVAPLAAGAFTACAAAAGLHVALPQMAREHAANTNLAYTLQAIRQTIPGSTDAGKAPVVFADQITNRYMLANPLQFAADVDLYASDAFSTRQALLRRGATEPGEPTPLQPARRDHLREVYDGKSAGDLAAEQRRILREALDAGRAVYAITNPSTESAVRKRLEIDGVSVRQAARFTEPVDVPAPRAGGPLSPQRNADPVRRAMTQPPRPPQTWVILEVVPDAPPEASQPTSPASS